jgi:hypothetical protein
MPPDWVAFFVPLPAYFHRQRMRQNMILEYDFKKTHKNSPQNISLTLNYFQVSKLRFFFANHIQIIFQNHIVNMKSYFIFAIVLTVAYIVYYAVIIVHDLYGKKGAGKMQEEVFDLGEPDDEESVAVTENETGFEVGSNAYETETADADRSAVPQAEAANTGISTQEKLERLKAKAEERMEESVPYLSDGRTAEEMYRAMVAGGRMDCRPEMEWKPLKERL